MIWARRTEWVDDVLLAFQPVSHSVVSGFFHLAVSCLFGLDHYPVYSSNQQTHGVVRACFIAISAQRKEIPVSSIFSFAKPATQWGQQAIVPGELQLTGGECCGTNWQTHLSPPNAMAHTSMLLIQGSDVNCVSHQCSFFERIFMQNFWIQN